MIALQLRPRVAVARSDVVVLMAIVAIGLMLLAPAVLVTLTTLTGYIQHGISARG